MMTEWPSLRRIRAHRSAVTRLPYRDPGGAGVTMPIFMLSAKSHHVRVLRSTHVPSSICHFPFSIFHNFHLSFVIYLSFVISHLSHGDQIGRSMLRWQMTNGKWQMTNGKWQMTNGKWQMKSITGSLQACESLRCAGTKSCPHVAAIRWVEVA